MATASPTANSRRPSLWRRPLLVGVCFGLGYGLTQRLLDLRLPGLVQWGQSFDVREAPGTSLESLRLRFGSEGQELRGRLDLQELKPAEPKAEQAPADPLTDPTGEAAPGSGMDGAAAEPAEVSAPKPPPAPRPAAPPRPAAAPPAPSLPPPSLPSQP
ncbi:MAG: hypothetical protein VKM98_09095 [Cyanobacteriota bacterium]|nr:hypothetical protein [Cyanobacteriota bacterium]